MRFEIDELRQYRCVYLIGIGGISMSALALILAEKGFEVRGYDRTESKVLETLRQAGIQVYLTDMPEAFENVDLVCYTAAVGSEHPQMKLASACGARIVSRAELLGCLASSYACSVAVAGTHGKSTTTGMLAHLLMHTDGYDPTVAVGAVLPELGAAYRIGKDDIFLYEACEYKDSFLSFFPKVAVVLNIQLDHTDYFHSLDQMIGSFTQFFRNSEEEGIGIYNLDCENCRRAAKGIEGLAITFSAEGNEEADYVAKNIDMTGGFAHFDVYERGTFLLHAELGVPGLHNVSNALAAIAVAGGVCDLLPEEIVSGLATYRGVSRRFEFLCEWNGARLYDDYAHHPEEIRATLATARAMTKGRVVCVFQPHNYSRLRDLFEDFCTAFTDADVLVLTKLYAAREAAGDEVSSALLAERTNAVYLDEKELIPEYLEQILVPGDTVLLVGAGDIGLVTEKFKKSGKIS